MIRLQAAETLQNLDREVLVGSIAGKSQDPDMIVDFSNRAFHFLKPILKPTFLVLIATLLWNTFSVFPAFSQTSQTPSATRKVKTNPPPEYPELARKMKIEGIARVLLTVSSDGNVIKVKELGGNPVLVDALAQATHKWKYEAAERQSEIEIRYEFVLSQ
jgi:TonB family protein